MLEARGTRQRAEADRRIEGAIGRGAAVADSGKAVKVKRNPPPTRRQRAIAREEARQRAAEAAEAKKAAKAAERSARGPKNGGGA